MKLIDQHMHTSFSFDSEANMEEYLNYTDNIIVTTEHIDYEDPYFNYQDHAPDYEEYIKEIERLNKMYGERVYPGIEIGYTPKHLQSIQNYLKDKYFALKLLSVHQNGTYDYMDREPFVNYTPQEMIEEYFNHLIMAVDALGDEVDILTHFDYGFRVHPITADHLNTYGNELFKTLVQKIMDKNIAFEINTSSMYKHGKHDLYLWALDKYQEYGGVYIALGSDAHYVKEYQREFPKVIELLKKYPNLKIERKIKVDESTRKYV